MEVPMLHKAALMLTASWHGAPLWAALVMGSVLIAEYLLGKYHPTRKSLVSLVPVAIKALGYVAAFMLSKMPGLSFVGEFLKGLLGPLVLVCFAASTLSGCATLKGKSAQEQIKIVSADVKQIRDDVEKECGENLAALVDVAKQAFEIAKSAPNALGIIMAAAQMLPEGLQAGEAVWCVMRVVRDDLKKMSQTQAAAVADDLIMMHEYQLAHAEVGATL